MARTKQTVRKSTGGKAPRKMLSLPTNQALQPQPPLPPQPQLHESWSAAPTQMCFSSQPARIPLSLTQAVNKDSPDRKKRGRVRVPLTMPTGDIRLGLDKPRVSFSFPCTEEQKSEDHVMKTESNSDGFWNSFVGLQAQNEERETKKRKQTREAIEHVVSQMEIDGVVPTVHSIDDLDRALASLTELFDSGFLQEVDFFFQRKQLEVQKKIFWATQAAQVPTKDYNSVIPTFGQNAKWEPSKNDRNVRIFVSSTFLDMQEERELLIRYTFPKLKKFCEERGLFLTQVDLRWGITEEDSNQGNTINICLKEVDKCRPYFIGMLGSRYGWHSKEPFEIDSDSRGTCSDKILESSFKNAVHEYPWIQYFTDRSITELEIRHACLNDPQSSTVKRALFYFKDTNSFDSSKLRALRTEIVDSGFGAKTYTTPELAVMVLQDLQKMLDEDFPLQDMPTPLEQERVAHQGFQKLRSRVYIGREEYFSAISDHVNSAATCPIVVTGESGSGKSSLMCNWAKRLAERMPSKVIITHFIGCTTQSTDLPSLLRRIMGEMKEKLGITRDIPNDAKQIPSEFREWLLEADHRGGFVLVLDALNQLTDLDAHALKWLPETFPKNIRVVLSALPGECMRQTRLRKWKTLKIEPLTILERKKLVEKYLGNFGKTLSETQIRNVTMPQQSSNPLFLRTLLEEIRVIGTFESLDRRIEYYLTARNILDLFSHVLERLENDYGNIVQDTLSFLWLSKKGLTETELISVLSVSPAVWAPFHAAMDEYLISRSGFLGFSHDFLRQAVEHKYMHCNYDIDDLASDLISYFRNNEEYSQRAVDELPHLYLKIDDFGSLSTMISSVKYFQYFNSPENQLDFYRYWRLCEANGRQPAKMIVDNLTSEQWPSEVLSKVGAFLQEIASYEEAEEILRETINVIKQESRGNSQNSEKSQNVYDMLSVARAQANLGYCLRMKGKYKEAVPLYQEALKVMENKLSSSDPLLAETINSLAMLYRYMGEYELAEPLYNRALQIRTKIYESVGEIHQDIAQSYNSLGCLNQDMGKFKDSEAYLLKAISMRELLLGPNHPDVAMSIVNLGGVYSASSRFEQAAGEFQKAMEIYRVVFGDSHPGVAQCMNNLAGIALEKCEFDEAEALYEEAYNIQVATLGERHPETAGTLSDMASLYVKLEDNSRAKELYSQALEIRLAVVGPNHPDVASCYSNLGLVAREEGEYESSEEYFMKAWNITSRVFGHLHMDTAQALKNLANVYQLQGRYDHAIGYYNNALDVFKSLLGENHVEVAVTFNDFAILQYMKGNYLEAEEFYQKSVGIYTSIFGESHPEVAQAVLNLAEFYKLRNASNALEYYEKVRKVYIERGIGGEKLEYVLRIISQLA
eukprot:TRINITY_DN1769_c0_g2_i1.p1 TRINITY_DN1769_c0_g2~~TRINITY_DN1769_c0_g2_i1.p1  ORF type:complete len:1372 (+),score=255.43 TRINITY_DN1769_c0_g2_i1:36-4151(+)